MLSAFLAAPPPGYGRRPARRRAASPSPAGSSTTRSAAWSRPPTRWSSRAPSPRPSAWSPPRRPRPASCRSRPRTRAPPRSAGRSPRRSRRRSAELVSFPLDEGAVEAIAERLNAWLRWTSRRASGRGEALARDGRASCGAGRGGARRARRLGGRARRALPVPRRRLMTHETSSGLLPAPSPRAIEWRAGDPRHACQAVRRDPRARPPSRRSCRCADRLGRAPQASSRGGPDRHAAQRDDRALVVRVRDRHGDARLLRSGSTGRSRATSPTASRSTATPSSRSPGR